MCVYIYIYIYIHYYIILYHCARLLQLHVVLQQFQGRHMLHWITWKYIHMSLTLTKAVQQVRVTLKGHTLDGLGQGVPCDGHAV